MHRSCVIMGARPPVRIARWGTAIYTSDGAQATPMSATEASMSCSRWFSREPLDFMGRLTLVDVVRLLGQSDTEIRALTPMAMFSLVEQALRSGTLVAYVGKVREYRALASAGTAQVSDAPAPTPVPEPVPASAQTYTCRWLDCQGEHDEDINSSYPNQGVLTHGKDSNRVEYADAWIAAGREPWEESGGPGVDPQAMREDYQRDLVGAGEPKPQNLVMIDLAVSAPVGQYVTQKHHLISVHLFDQVPKIKSNARLISYNANDNPNGICLPYFTIDIVRHDRQCHRGPHPPAYDKRVLQLLRALQNESVGFCTSGSQDSLKQRLDEISERVRHHVLGWQKGWYLRTKAETERAEAYRRIGQDVPT
jgi:hypothetical protein